MSILQAGVLLAGTIALEDYFQTSTGNIQQSPQYLSLENSIVQPQIAALTIVLKMSIYATKTIQQSIGFTAF